MCDTGDRDRVGADQVDVPVGRSARHVRSSRAQPSRAVRNAFSPRSPTWMRGPPAFPRRSDRGERAQIEGASWSEVSRKCRNAVRHPCTRRASLPNRGWLRSPVGMCARNAFRTFTHGRKVQPARRWGAKSSGAARLEGVPIPHHTGNTRPESKRDAHSSGTEGPECVPERRSRFGERSERIPTTQVRVNAVREPRFRCRGRPIDAPARSQSPRIPTNPPRKVETDSLSTEPWRSGFVN